MSQDSNDSKDSKDSHDSNDSHDSSHSYDPDFERGLANRRRMLGDAWVDQSIGKANSFNAEFQNFITRYAWHDIWGRPGLPPKTRRVIVLSITAALGRWEEFELHTRAALQGGPEDHLSPDELREVLMQSAIYAGVPAANTAFNHALKVLRELGYELPHADGASVTNQARGLTGRTASRPALGYSVREARSGSARHTVVLSHSLGFDSSMWDRLANALCAEHRVICYDHRGHGGSEVPPGPYRIQDLGEDAERLLAELDAGPVVWIGHSLGGMVGQELALLHPSRVKALVIANSCAEIPEAGRAVFRERASQVKAAGMAAVADGVMERCFSATFRETHAGAVAGYRRRVMATVPDGYAACCEALASHDSGARLAQLRCPVLVIASALDKATPPELSRSIVERVRGAALVVLPDAAHHSPIELPAVFESELRRFMRPLAVSSYM